MKKILVLVIAMVIIVCGVMPASAACMIHPVAMSDGGGSNSRSNNTSTTTQTASGSGVNQSVIVQGNGDAVNVQQVVNGGGDKHYHYDQSTTVVNEITEITIIQEVPMPEEAPKPDYNKMKETIAVYGNAFIEVLRERLRSEGWVLLWSVDVTQTHNYVMNVTFVHDSGVVLDGYKVQYYSRDGEHYEVALTTV